MKEIEQLYQTYKLTQDPKILVLILKRIKTYWDKKELSQNLKEDYQELKNLIELKDSCDIEFNRNNKRVLCSNEYEIKIIDENLVADYIKKTQAM